MLPKRIVVLEPTAIFDARSTVVTQALLGLGDQVSVERIEPFAALEELAAAEKFIGKIEGADLLVFLESIRYYRVLARMVARTHPRLPVFLAGHVSTLSDEEYPPHVTLFAVTKDPLEPLAVFKGMLLFDADVLRTKIVEVLGLSAMLKG